MMFDVAAGTGQGCSPINPHHDRPSAGIHAHADERGYLRLFRGYMADCPDFRKERTRDSITKGPRNG